MKRADILREEFSNGKYEELLKKIYVDTQMIPYQNKRYAEALGRYMEIFGEGDAEIYSTPGRSEVGGNHTDHQQGMVLAASINLDAIAVAGYNDENCIKVFSEGHGLLVVNLSELEVNEEEAGTSLSLIRGVACGFAEHHFPSKGFNAYITSDVLSGSGLSSSAVFEVILGTVISGLFHNMFVDSVEIAQIAQYAENVFFQKPCGLLDQMACSVGGLIHIDFQDKQNPVVKKLEMDFEQYQYSLCIVDTKGSHADMTDEYASIPEEMKKVAAYYGKKVLREVDEQEFYKTLAAVRAKAGDRAVLRAIHFFNEERRVAGQAEALQEGRVEDFLRLVKESGSSSFQYLQNIYSNQDVSSQNMSLALAISERSLGSAGVSRVHGGGFAGTVQAFVSNDFVEEYREVMENVFGNEAVKVLKIRQYGGIKVI